MHNAKRQRLLGDSDPIAEAMQQFNNNIGKEVDGKKREIENLDNEMKVRVPTDIALLISNCIFLSLPTK